MTGSAPGAERLGFLDVARGCAALIVLLVHGFNASTPRYPPRPDAALTAGLPRVHRRRAPLRAAGPPFLHRRLLRVWAGSEAARLSAAVRPETRLAERRVRDG